MLLMTVLRVATWNLNYRSLLVAPALGEFLRQFGVDLVLLQEANPSSLNAVREAAGLDWSVSAFDAGAPLPGGRSGRRRVAAVAGRGERPSRFGLLHGLALPERAVWASVATTLGPLTVASYHAPPGVSWGSIKVDHAHALLRWIDNTPGPLVVGADANTPEIDHPDPAKVRTHWHTGARKLAGAPGDDITFGGTPQHRLRDAYRRWLDEHPTLKEDIEREQPSGPLAVSHRTGKRRTSLGNPRRFDVLWVSPDLAVRYAEYDYAGGIAAGSDHALVIADLAVIGPSRPTEFPASRAPTEHQTGSRGASESDSSNSR